MNKFRDIAELLPPERFAVVRMLRSSVGVVDGGFGLRDFEQGEIITESVEIGRTQLSRFLREGKAEVVRYAALAEVEAVC